MTKINFAHKPTQWLILGLLALTWGSSFILMKKGLVYFSGPEVAAFRVSLAMLVLSPIAIRNLNSLKGNFWSLLTAGLFGNALPAFLFAIAQTEVPSALSGILNSLTSLFTLLIGVVFFRSKTTWVQVAGVVLALAGAIGLIGASELVRLSETGRYALLIVAATVMYGIAVNTIKSKLTELRPTQITSLSFLITGPWCLVYLLFATDFPEKISSSTESWIGVFYLSILAIVGTALAVIIFNQLIKETTAVFATTVTYLIPIVALGWGLIDGEHINPTDIIYMVLILMGIFLINTKGASKRLNKLFR